MKGKNKWQRLGLAVAFACVAGVVRAEGAADIITDMTTDVTAIITALSAMVGALIAAAAGVWLAIVAYKRGRGAAKQVV